MPTLDIENSLVLVIDLQEKLLNAAFNKESIQKKSEVLLKATNILGIPIIITEQYPKGLGNTADFIKNIVSNKTSYFEKTAFSALENIEVFNTIKSLNRKQIIIMGIETHICVNQTTTALIEAGYEVYVVIEACGSRTEFEHNAGLDRMKANGAKLLTTEIAIFEWLKTSKHPNFKEVQNLIK